MLKVLYLDSHIVAIHKPPGMLVHRTRISDGKVFALQTLRDQLGQRVYPVHRLDRPTAGVLLFALRSEIARLLVDTFSERRVRKSYRAIVRGHIHEAGRLDYPLTRDDGKKQQAVTAYQPLDTSEIMVPVDRYPTSRYSLMKIVPQTGRMHQIRKHFAHLRHPILNDRKHGDRHHNRMFREKFSCDTMMLLAHSLEFEHPVRLETMRITTDPEPEMTRMLKLLNLKGL
ncbi:MAG TPA: pseudouridylate synthase [Bacteroidetes bacterium]|nr:pseudouridylate synthase [Bacteroidota bacterium]